MKNITHQLCLFIGILSFIYTGCGTTISSLIGSEGPIDEKSSQYGVMILSRQSSDWIMIASGKVSDTETQIADTTYQNIQSQGIISINSSCNSAVTGKPNPLSNAMNLLFLGMKDISSQKEETLVISGYPALSRTTQGEMDGLRTKIQAIVVQKNDCIYDLMYVSSPEHFEDDQAIFTQFVSSLRLK